MENEYYEGIINQVSSRLALCDIPELGSPIKIGGKFLKRALEGDKVLLKVKENKYGFVQKILERNKRTLTGQIQIAKGFGFIKPWNSNYYKDFFVDKKLLNGVKDGDVVEFEIISWNKKDRSPKAKVIKPIYNASESQYMMYKMNLPTKFPSEVVEELKGVNLSEADYVGRNDLRDLEVISIDPEGCTDADDALSLENLDDGYRVGIHIADVSHYIKPGTELDKEAFKRSFTTYLPDCSIPMIPNKLSGDLCSLIEGQDRLAVSLFITFDRDWNIKKTNVERTVINNNKFLTYEEAQVEKDNPDSKYYRQLNTLYTIGKKIQKEHFSNEISLNLPELSWVMDDNGNPIKLKVKKRNECMDLIQAWMLMSNKIVTQMVHKINPQSPWIYRTHNSIEDENIDELKLELAQLDETWNDSLTHNENIKRLLESENSELLSQLIIKKFRPAKYSPVRTGHFSLGADDYTHFTSPIRRYTDIIIHRILLPTLKGKHVYCADLERDCTHISQQERKIDKIERHFKKVNSLKFVKDITYSFKSKIIFFNSKGIFVKTELLVDAWIVSKSLEEMGMSYDEDKRIWVNPSYALKIGDTLKTKIERLNWDKNEIILKID
jgi:ribonuclease R